MSKDPHPKTKRPTRVAEDLLSRGVSRREFLRLAAVGGSAAAFLAACAQTGVPVAGEAPAAGADAAGEAAAAPQGGTIIWMGHQEVAGLSPNDEGATVQWFMIALIHNALMQINTRYEAEPVLAESVDVSEDGLTYTFKLRQGILFHDGTEFTSADVKYTYDFYSNPDNASVIANDWLGMESVETPDPYTAIVHMSEINADFLKLGACNYIVPAAYHAEVGEDVYRTAPIGTGPFRLAEWVPAEYTLLEAFDDHFRGRPILDFVRQNVVPEPSVRAIALETGEAHATVWPLLVEDSVRLRDEGYLFYGTPANSVKHFPLNNKLPQLSDKRVRQAMLMALDRQRIIDELWNGVADVAVSYFTPANATYHNPNVKQYPFDPDAARALLDEAGWTLGNDGVREKDGLKLSFICTTITGDQARRPIAELAQQLLKDVGVDMQLQEAPVATIFEGLRTGTIDSTLFNWTYGDAISPDPSGTLRSDGADNWSHFEHARADELIDIGRTTVDVAARQAAYAELQEIVAEEVPFLYLQFDQWIYIFRTEVGGLPDPETVLAGDYIFPNAHLMTVSNG